MLVIYGFTKRLGPSNPSNPKTMPGQRTNKLNQVIRNQKHPGQGHLMIGKAFFPKWSQTFVPKSWMTNKPLKKRSLNMPNPPKFDSQAAVQNLGTVIEAENVDPKNGRIQPEVQKQHHHLFSVFQILLLGSNHFRKSIFHIPRTHKNKPLDLNILLDWPAKG